MDASSTGTQSTSSVPQLAADAMSQAQLFKRHAFELAVIAFEICILVHILYKNFCSGRMETKYVHCAGRECYTVPKINN
jgi:hypothetical protein